MKTEALRSAAICGFRNKGRKLYEYLKQKNIHIPYIIERNYEALAWLETGLDIPIVGFNENADFYRHAEAVILSGDLPEDTVKECLMLAGIDIPVISNEWE